MTTPTPAALDALKAQVATLTADLAEARSALQLFQSYGCPICNGDCASANPPVVACPMQAARAAPFAPPDAVEAVVLAERSACRACCREAADEAQKYYGAPGRIGANMAEERILARSAAPRTEG